MFRGDNNNSWKGGRYTDEFGYVQIRKPTSHLADQRGYVKEHRLVMEESLGRELSRIEVVHHINGIKSDNRIENLKLFHNSSEHIRPHLSHMINGRDWELVKMRRRERNDVADTTNTSE
jgi:hypothetical protein